MSAFKKAVKGARPFRIAIDGPSGSGKTFTGLAILSGLTDNFCVIDTERGSASLYADRFSFDTMEPADHSPKTYVAAIKDAERAGYKGIMIDSLSHAWMGRDGALEQVDKAAKRSQSGNSFTAWRDVTPMHNELVDTIINSKCHIIATMRSKMEYVLEEVVRNGKKTQQPRKIGLAPVQRDGVEYEFDIIADMDLDHNLIISKTRLDNLDGLVMNKPGADFVEKLNEWLATTCAVEQSRNQHPEATPRPKSEPANDAAKSSSSKSSGDASAKAAESKATPDPKSASGAATASAGGAGSENVADVPKTSGANGSDPKASGSSGSATESKSPTSGQRTLSPSSSTASNQSGSAPAQEAANSTSDNDLIYDADWAGSCKSVYRTDGTLWICSG
jgi:hypothetical protein